MMTNQLMVMVQQHEVRVIPVPCHASSYKHLGDAAVYTDCYKPGGWRSSGTTAKADNAPPTHTPNI